MTLDNLTGLANISEHDDEMFLEAFAAASNGEMTSLERDPDMLMGKFDDSFTNMGGEDPFRSSVDAEALFFGSP
jgi:regulatory protein SWI5